MTLHQKLSSYNVLYISKALNISSQLVGPNDLIGWSLSITVLKRSSVVRDRAGSADKFDGIQNHTFLTKRVSDIRLGIQGVT